MVVVFGVGVGVGVCVCVGVCVGVGVGRCVNGSSWLVLVRGGNVLIALLT